MKDVELREDEASEGSPYGWRGTRIGQAALTAAADLAVEPEWRGGVTPHLVESDWNAFASTARCILEIDESRFALEIHTLSFAARVDNLHRALPFTEAERRYVAFDAGGRMAREDPRGFTMFVGRNGPYTLEAGRPHLILGRELLSRWWSWRRGILDFERPRYDLESGEKLRTVDIARRALTGIADIVLPSGEHAAAP